MTLEFSLEAAVGFSHKIKRLDGAMCDYVQDAVQANINLQWLGLLKNWHYLPFSWGALRPFANCQFQNSPKKQ
jgi:hypothetical protein